MQKCGSYKVVPSANTYAIIMVALLPRILVSCIVTSLPAALTCCPPSEVKSRCSTKLRYVLSTHLQSKRFYSIPLCVSKPSLLELDKLPHVCQMPSTWIKPFWRLKYCRTSSKYFLIVPDSFSEALSLLAED